MATRTILIVDDDAATRSLLAAGLRRLPDCRTVLASHGAEALELFKAREIDLLITDLRMPVLDGYALIAIVRQLYPNVPVVVITAVEEMDHQNLPTTLGAQCIFTKPLRLSQMLGEIRALLSHQPAKGATHGLGLISILQLLEWEQKDATLKVTSGDRSGTLHVRQGQLVHATAKGQSGIEAARTMLVWDHPAISFGPLREVARTIETSLTEILLAAAIHLDESGRPPEP
jgi:CheY-like chemotaxis protein